MKDDSWAWKNFSRFVHSPPPSFLFLISSISYFRKFEAYQPHPSFPDVDTSARGLNGPVQVGYFNTITEPSRKFVQACIGVGIPFIRDFNGVDGTIGVSRISE